MSAPLEGVRVLEVANWLAVPGAAMLLADMGANVIKVEPPTGDAWRAFNLGLRGWESDFPGSPMFELDNRGKRSIAVNLDHPEGRAVVQRLAVEADIFMTNLVMGRRERYGLTYLELAAANPRLIYLGFSGYGDRGDERDRLTFDYGAFWSRSGILGTMGDPALPPPTPRTGTGDHATSPLLLAAVLAALYERERSGQGQEVTTSLLNAALWMTGADLQATLVLKQPPQRYGRAAAPNPLLNTYQAGDGRWFMLVMTGTDIYWPNVCRALGRPEWEHDPRFANVAARREHARELITLMDAAFAEAPVKEWAARLDAEGTIWAPIQDLSEVAIDPQVRANGYLTSVEHPNFGPYRTLATPIQFSRSEVGPQGAAPEVGQHTEEVLLEAGYSWDEITRLREAGSIGI